MRRRKSKDVTDVKERASELKDQAREVAGHSSEALKDFAAQTGTAAKDFAGKASEAAKELVESIEKAAKGVSEKEEPRRGRRFLKLTLAVGAGVAVFTNERVRNAISSMINRERSGDGDQPEIWRPESSTGGNAQKSPASETKTT